MPLPRRIVVDDTDSRITYLGQGWFLDQGSLDNIGNYGQPWKHTTHGTNINGSFSFQFEGTSIALGGTAPNFTRIDNNTRWDPSWECFVDQISVGSSAPVSASSNSWNYCYGDALADGPHTFTVNVTTAGNTFWADKLIVEPSAKLSFKEEVFTIDNSDPSIILDSTWKDIGAATSRTSVKGAQAQFNFIGKSVTWFGYINKGPQLSASASYSIDGESPVPFNLTALPSDATDTAHNHIFFATPDLSPGLHSLLVIYNGADSGGAAVPLTLDFLYVALTSNNQPSTGTTLPISTGTTTTSSGTTLPASSSSAFAASSSSATTPVFPNNLPAGSGAQQGNTLIPVGPIVGGTLGGLVLIVLFVFFVVWKRRNQHRPIPGSSSNLVNGVSTLTPFVSIHGPSKHQPYNSNALPSIIPPSTKSPVTRPFVPQNINQTVSHGSHSDHRTGSINNRDISGAHRAVIDATDLSGNATQPAVTPIVHLDSGARFHGLQENTVVQDIPPTYTAH